MGAPGLPEPGFVEALSSLTRGQLRVEQRLEAIQGELAGLAEHLGGRAPEVARPPGTTLEGSLGKPEFAGAAGPQVADQAGPEAFLRPMTRLHMTRPALQLTAGPPAEEPESFALSPIEEACAESMASVDEAPLPRLGSHTSNGSAPAEQTRAWQRVSAVSSDVSTGHDGRRSSRWSRVSHTIGRSLALRESAKSEWSHCMTKSIPVNGRESTRAWPGDVEMRSGFALHGANCRNSNDCHVAPPRHRKRRHRMSDAHSGKPDASASECCLMVNPVSSFSLAWSMSSALFLLFDMTVLPLVLAWDIELTGWLWVMGWVTASFWTLDFFLCFITGIHKGGRLDMRLRQVVRHYLTTWCVPDLLVLSCDWASMLLHLASGSSLDGTDAMRVLRIGKTVKMLRLVGLTRLTRFVRMARIMKIVKDSFSSKAESFPVSSQCIFLTVCALWLNHALCCIWFAIGRGADTDTGMRWTDTYLELNGVQLPFTEESHFYQYVSSLHWSFAQFTLGASDIPTTNSWERLFNIACLMSGLIFGSTLVSSLSAGMVDFQMRSMERTQKLRRLQRFLRENKVGQGTSLLVQEQVAERLKIQERLKEDDVWALTILSNALRTELRYDIAKPQVSTLPLFDLLGQLDSALFQAICMQAVGFAYPHQQDDLFAAGTRTDKAYRLTHGSMVYVQDPAESPVVVEDCVTPVEQGTWLAEASLWTCWTHVGTCKAKASCQVLTVDAVELARICQQQRAVQALFAEYCRNYHQQVIVARPPDKRWCSDLQVPGTDWGALVAAMEQEARSLASVCVVEQLEGSFAWLGQGASLEALRKDVTDGDACIIMDAHGQPERLVSAVSLHLTDSDGSIFARIGKTDAGRHKACCKLPSIKLHAGESSESGVTRLMGSLGLSAEDVWQYRLEEERVDTKQSAKFGLRSKCTTTVVHMEVKVDIPLPQLSGVHRSEHGRHALMSPAHQHTSMRASLGNGTGEHGPIDPDLLSTGVFVTRSGDCQHLFAWLPSWRFEQFTSAAGKRDLASWHSHIKRSNRLGRNSGTAVSMVRASIHD
mmetsp:Transcript_28450/g.88484  ORF Transcript_28450/g.88484 Transcript_28450/m.88484 type:complete len:1049 (-) Transcript_28450:47-3193(-)